MSTQPANVTLARRRFLWIAAASAGAALMSACAAGTDSAKPSTLQPNTPQPTSEPPADLGESASPEPGNPNAQVQRLVSTAKRTTPGNPGTAGAAMAGFGADFLRSVRGADANTVISPYSLYTVLAMARAGAKSETAAQLDELLRLAGPTEQGAAITAIDAGIAAAVDLAEQVQMPITIQASNETWVQQDFAVHQEYLDELAREFGVSAVGADFMNEPEAMRVAINTWVSERTNELIPQLFPPDSITDATRLVLVNALYLKASWVTPFYPVPATAFTTGSGDSIQLPMMSAGPLPGTAGDGWTAVTVPYSGSGVVMTLLVPDLGTFDTVLAALDADLLTAAANRGGNYLLTMPPFKITSAPDVATAAQALGVVDLFSELMADLSGIAGQPGDLYASAFVHQATITVDENGTEASAATGLSASATSAPAEPPTPLVIDRPYIFWIAETATGAPLFLGVVTDPSS